MNRYTLDVSKEDLIDCYVKQLTLKWCKDNHPEIIQEIKKKLETIYNETHNNQSV